MSRPAHQLSSNAGTKARTQESVAVMARHLRCAAPIKRIRRPLQRAIAQRFSALASKSQVYNAASLSLAADINRCSRGRKLIEIANSHQARGWSPTEAWNWFQTLTGLRRFFQMPLRPRSFLVLLLLSCP